MYTSQYE
jgi:hypothetical protein